MDAPECQEDTDLGVLKSCSDERKRDILEFQLKVHSKSDAEKYTNNAVCLDTSSLYIQGEPDTRTEASVSIVYEVIPELWPLPWKAAYEECQTIAEQQYDLCSAVFSGKSESVQMDEKTLDCDKVK